MKSSLDAANSARALKSLESQILSLGRSLEYFKERCRLLESIIATIDPKLLPPKSISRQNVILASGVAESHCEDEDPLEEGDESLSQTFVNDILRNASKKPNGRQWSPIVKDLCFVIRALGSKSYDYMRNFITLPSKQTLLGQYQDDMTQYGSNLIDMAAIPLLCQSFRKRSAIDTTEEVGAVLAVDAMAMEPFSDLSNPSEPPHNSLFLFQVLPLKCDQKAFPLHLMTRSSGTAGVDVLERIDCLRGMLKESGVVIHAIATDGDPAYNCFHEELFDAWLPTFSKCGLDAAVALVSGRDRRVVSDFLHLLKNARSRLLNCSVTMSPIGAAPFNSNDLNEHLHLRAALTDLSTKGRMRDIYPLELFTLENFCALHDSGHLSMALYILPYALMVHAIRNPGISVQMRRQLLGHVVQIFVYHIDALSSVDKTVVSENKRNGVVQYFCSRRHAIRICNTAMILLVELNKIKDSLALDRLGTHVTECTFGLIRLMCHNKHNWKTIHRSFARVTLLEDLAGNVDHPIRIGGRENVGGTKIVNENKDNIFVLAKTCDIARIYENSLLLISPDQDIAPEGSKLYEKAREALNGYVAYIKEFCKVCTKKGVRFAKLWHGSNVSNSTILSRLISFSRVPSDESQACTPDEDDVQDEKTK